MKITETGPLGGSSKTKKARKSGDSGFAGFLSAAEEAAEAEIATRAGGTAPVGNVTALLALQEISPEEGRRRQVMQQGHSSLDALDDLRREILIGRLDQATVGKMQRQLDALKSADTEDPHLKAIIGDIELRLAVEIAKLERA